MILQNKRTAKSLTLSLGFLGNPKPVSATRACALVRYDAQKMSDDSFSLLQQFNTCPAHQASWYVRFYCYISCMNVIRFYLKNI